MLFLGTDALKAAESQSGFSLLLLHVIRLESTEMNIRHAASIYFKNLIMNNWVPDEGETDIFSLEDRNTIKQHIIQLMLTLPHLLQAQLHHALAIISTTDFPRNWTNLLPELMSYLSSDDYTHITSVLETFNYMFHKYRVQGNAYIHPQLF